jgi:hypothetical protein
MLFLLDGLHEDMNRVQKKPFVEKIESNGRPDSLISREAWRRFLLRNDSVVVDKMFGQLKSHVTCRNCGYESVTFDEFNSLSLPVPVKNTRRVSVTVFPLPVGTVPITTIVDVEMTGSVGDLKKIIASQLSAILRPAAPKAAAVAAGTNSEAELEASFDVVEKADVEEANMCDSPVMVDPAETGSTSPPPPPYAEAAAAPAVSEQSPAAAAGGGLCLHVCILSTYSKKITWTLSDETPVQDLIKNQSYQQVIMYQLEQNALIKEESEHNTYRATTYNYSSIYSYSGKSKIGSTSSEDADKPTGPVYRYVDVAMMRQRAQVSGGYATSNTYTYTHTTHSSHYSGYPVAFAAPIRLTIELGVSTIASVYDAIERGVMSFVPSSAPFKSFSRRRMNVDGENAVPAPFKVYYSNSYGDLGEEIDYSSSTVLNDIVPRNQLICLWSEEALADVGAAAAMAASTDVSAIPAQWTPRSVSAGLNSRRSFIASSEELSVPFEVVSDPVATSYRPYGDEPEPGAADKKSIDITDCLNKFVEREVLPEEETWYCPRCKQHKSPIKKFDLWAAPDILIVQLKRFQYIPGSYFIHREKINDLVQFPIEGLDLSAYVKGPTGPSEPIYDLFGVSEHSGGLGGGHYTAVCKSPGTNEW